MAVAMALACALLCGGAGQSVLAAPAAADADAPASGRLLVMLRMPPPHFRAGAAYEGSYPNDGNRQARRRAAEDIARDHHLRVLDDWPMPVIGVDCFVMERIDQAPDTGANGVLAALAHDPRVAWAQADNRFEGFDGGDPLYPVQPDGKYWHVAELHRVSTGRGVRIAVVDSGIDARHPDLQGQVEVQENFVEDQPAPAEAHGTAVAGIAAARAGNGQGIAGVAPDARLMALRACWQAASGGTVCSSFTLGKALNYAVLHDARIINLSLAGPADRLLAELLRAAGDRGSTVVAAVDPARADGGFPASSGLALAVAAQSHGSRAAARGVLLAPGTDIPTCVPGGRWGFVSGTSFATAHVAGLAALLAQLLPGASPAQLRRDIVASGDVGRIERAGNRGAATPAGGTIDACASIAHAAGACACSCPSTTTPKASKPRQHLPQHRPDGAAAP
jgi:subtilisin family serine protease